MSYWNLDYFLFFVIFRLFLRIIRPFFHFWRLSLILTFRSFLTIVDEVKLYPWHQLDFKFIINYQLINNLLIPCVTYHFKSSFIIAVWCQWCWKSPPFFTRKCFLIVNTHMSPQIATLKEFAMTFTACIRFFLRMATHVYFERAWPHKFVLAFFKMA